MRKALVLEADRVGYSIGQIAGREAITVGDLIEFLQEFPEDTLFVLSHDRGYTYGSVNPRDEYMVYEEHDEEWEEIEYYV